MSVFDISISTTNQFFVLVDNDSQFRRTLVIMSVTVPTINYNHLMKILGKNHASCLINKQQNVPKPVVDYVFFSPMVWIGRNLFASSSC